jgi:ABC-2 type transport system ATP-binding protein
MASIRVQDLVKRYKNGTANAVNGVSFDVEPGEFFALLGPNGAGKTTTVSILTTTLSMTSGHVTVAGHDIDSAPGAVRREVGIIFQTPSLDQNLTGEENIRFHAFLYGLYGFRPSWSTMPDQYKQQVYDLSAVLGIDSAVFRPVKTYSGGMRRKLEIMRSLMHRPRVLFLDEPTSGLDPGSRRSLWEYIRTVRRESGTTVFLTTHYLEEAEGVDRVAILNRGRIVSIGTPAQVKADLIEDYLLIDADDRPRLVDELSRKQIAYSSSGPFKVALDGATAHQILRAIETPLCVVRTHTPSLEDAYLEIIGAEAT